MTTAHPSRWRRRPGGGSLVGIAAMAITAVAGLWVTAKSPHRFDAAFANDGDEPTTIPTRSPSNTRSRTPRAASAPQLDQAKITAMLANRAAAGDPDERRSDKDATSAARAAQSERYQRAEAAFLAQRRDPIWAPHAEAVTRDALAPRLGKIKVTGTLLDVSCRASWCTIDLLNPAPADLPIVDETISDVSTDLAATEGKVLESRLSVTKPDGRVQAARYYLRFSRS
jgi:hypothetical protein